MPNALPKKLINMSEYKIQTYYKQSLAYVPKPLIKILGKTAKAYVNCLTVLMVPENTSLEEVLESLRIIESHIQLKLKVEKKEVINE